MCACPAHSSFLDLCYNYYYNGYRAIVRSPMAQH